MRPAVLPLLSGLAAALLSLACALAPLPASAQATPFPAPPGTTVRDPLVQEAREAWGRRDRVRLSALKAAALAMNHPLASWVDYWEITPRLGEVGVPEVEAFYARWPGSYVEDRLRNDWLLELGRRRDWPALARDFPRFRMNDDRQVTCYWLITEHLAGRNVRNEAMAAWLAQREGDDGCALMAATLHQAGVLRDDDVWRGLRQAVELNRRGWAMKAAPLLGSPATGAMAEVLDQPQRWLRRGPRMGRAYDELGALALIRVAGGDPAAAAAAMEERWERSMPHALAGDVWAQIAKQSAWRLLPEALPQYQRAVATKLKGRRDTLDWGDDLLGWYARAALRNGRGAERWTAVQQAIDAMSPTEQRDPTWAYWKARALRALAKPGPDGDAQRAEAQAALQAVASPLHFYGQLAAEDLGQPLALPPKPAPVTAAEREAARSTAGLQRALQLIALGLRSEGVREWNFMLRGLDDRQLLAAAQWACEREVWDRCINSSDRTRAEVDLDQRYPMPFRQDVIAQSRETGIDPAYVYGLIRQESRFILDARSHVGASGLMQVMPATARWTARKLGLAFTPDMITDREMNLRIGTGYLKLVLEDFGGSQALAAAAYNAGPSRPRRWREGPVLEPAMWAENIPFNETRDYVKKVLANAAIYSALIKGEALALKGRLGSAIGPREGPPNPLDAELP
ncbi:lytic transglycosylase domain-containing protein [Aquabacterium sp. J223]|uniref:lytic transglycosylase domain-containing protein n=1 Tax=Aquabacterium sp. J223 TaxID=2898431 RepID=UPI0021ADF577|nr:lytic transglycosylase domain-containing protein [Aquabacterium sp. J223]